MAAGAVSLKNLTKCEEVRKGTDQAKCMYFFRLDLLTEVESHPDQFFRGKARDMYNSNLKRVADFLGLNILMEFS